VTLVSIAANGVAGGAHRFGSAAQCAGECHRSTPAQIVTRRLCKRNIPSAGSPFSAM
jgi:hypothetical protein